MTATLRVATAIAAHDIAGELRRPVATWGVLCFGVSSLVVLRLALAGGARPTAAVLAGALWIVLLFAALLATGRVLAVEREGGTWDALLLAPVDRSAVFLGKAAGACALVLLLDLVLVPLYLLLFAAPALTWAGVGTLALAVALAAVGMGVTGVLVGSLALHARNRELLAAAAFLPLAIPLVIAAVTATLAAYGGAPTADRTQLLGFLALYDAVFIAAGIAAFGELAVE